MIFPDSARRLAALLLAAALPLGPAWAQAGDQPFDDIDVIELPGQTPNSGRGLSLNWGCEVLLIEDSRRFRAGHCPGDEKPGEAIEELTVEDASAPAEDSAAARRRKLIY